MNSSISSPISRRKTLGRIAAGGLGALAGSVAAPFIHAQKRPKLRVLGTHVTLQEQLRQRAEMDLGIELEFSPGGSAEILHQAITRPESFDLYEQWSNSIRVLWEARAIQPIELSRLTHWDQVNDLTKKGKLNPEAKLGAGDNPNGLLYCQADGKLGSRETSSVSFLPYVHNVDSFGYNSNIVHRGEAYRTESWGWLLDRAWAGRVAIVNEPTIGLFDLALAAQSIGKVQIQDIGDITRAEIDELFSYLIELRRKGHFRGVWESVPRSVQWMRDGDAVIESMFSPAVFSLRAENIPCVYASPKEGYRAWHGVMCLSSQTTGHVKDAAYQYMNWWLSGWPGAFIARQGYYISTPELSREHLSDQEWGYWYEGSRTNIDLPGTDGRAVASAGSVRDGGSYQQRFGNIAVWNTVMDTYEYTLKSWNQFLCTA